MNLILTSSSSNMIFVGKSCLFVCFLAHSERLQTFTTGLASVQVCNCSFDCCLLNLRDHIFSAVL